MAIGTAGRVRYRRLVCVAAVGKIIYRPVCVYVVCVVVCVNDPLIPSRFRR
jgi:hypothetical protein